MLSLYFFEFRKCSSERYENFLLSVKKMIVSCSLSKCCLKNWFSYRELFLKHMAYGKFSFTVDVGYELDHFGFKGKYFLVSFNLIISHWCTFCFYGNSYCQFYLEYIYLTPMSNLWRVLGESTRLYTDFFCLFQLQFT